MHIPLCVALIISLITCLVNNPVVLIALILLIWLIRKAINTPPDPRNDL